jgi:trimethylamine--corrinoid protein Co-methyltransferase
MLVEQGLTYFGTGPDCIYVHDPYTRERRRARLKDIVASAHLCDQLDDVDFVMSMGLAEDAPISCDDLLQFRAMLSGTTKPLVVSTSHGGDGLEAMLEMAGIYGERGSFGCLIMSSPPLKFDANAADKLIACARLGVPIILAPAPSAGATAPASISAAVVVGDAEVMAGLCIHQLAAAGAPFVYGVGASAMDMRTALDPYVGPDHFLGNQAACDLARSYGIPSWSYAGPSDAKTLDEQWSADVAVTALLGALSRATLLHDLGYMESGMAGSPESIVLGAELVGFVRSFLRELPLDDDSLQLEAIIAAGPGGNYLGHPHTRRHHREFWQTNLFDHDVFERWHAGGAATLRDRVAERTLKLLDAPGELGLCDDEDRTIDEVIATVARSRG